MILTCTRSCHTPQQQLQHRRVRKGVSSVSERWTINGQRHRRVAESQIVVFVLLLIVIDHVVRMLLLGLQQKQNIHLDEYHTPQTFIAQNKNFQTTENLPMVY